jgi:hypothetical protein
MVLGPYNGPSVDSPLLLELVVSCLVSLGYSLEQGGRSSRNCSIENRWLEAAVVASLLPSTAMGKELDGTATAAAVAGTMGDCPNIVIEDHTAILKVGYTTYGTSEEHR